MTPKNDEYTGLCVDTISCANGVDTLCSQYVEDISFVCLKGSDTHPISDPTKVLANANGIFLFSKKNHKIVAYTHGGDFMYEVDHRGHGSKEYLEIANFCVNDNHIYIVDNARHCVMIYDAATGAYQGKRPLVFNAWDMECLSDNEFLFTCLQNNPEAKFDMPQPQAAVWKTDSTFSNILHEYLPYPEGYCEMIGKRQYFTRSGKDIVFHSYQNEGCFIFRANSDSLLYIDAVLPRPIPGDKAYSYHEVMEREYTYMSETPLVGERYICFDCGCGVYYETYLVHRPDKHVTKNKEVDSEKAILSPALILGDKFVSCLYDYDIYESLVSSGFKKADGETEEILRRGGICLVVYTMK